MQLFMTFSLSLFKSATCQILRLLCELTCPPFVKLYDSSNCITYYVFAEYIEGLLFAFQYGKQMVLDLLTEKELEVSPGELIEYESLYSFWAYCFRHIKKDSGCNISIVQIF